MRQPEGSEELMKKVDTKMEDELRPEYDLGNLRVRKVGPERKSFGGPAVRLEPDVAEIFPDAESVNEALRLLIRITRENRPTPGNKAGIHSTVVPVRKSG